jgi:hypothetical protein
MMTLFMVIEVCELIIKIISITHGESEVAVAADDKLNQLALIGPSLLLLLSSFSGPTLALQ